MKTIYAYTDGSCAGNPGVGGYAAILRCGDAERTVRGCVSDVTTNNAMELKAVLETVAWCNRVQKDSCEIIIHTDSKYLIDCACGKQKDGSKRTVGWFRGRKNEDMWFQLIQEVVKGKHTVRFVKVKGHGSDEMNNRADTIAKEECTRAKHELLKKG